jgi:hypothetical protein
LPLCDTSTASPRCRGCLEASECDDGNDCTEDSCSEGTCGHATLRDGTPCAQGYCNGIPGGEVCVTRRCLADEDCDDGADCTLDVCNDSSLCTYTTDDGQCPASDDACRPNRCTVGTGCQQVDSSRSLELLENGNLDAGNVDWMEMSVNYDQVIFVYGYVPTLQPHTTPNIAWLGGGEGLLDEYNSLGQRVAIPAGAVSLELSFFYQIWPQDDLPEFHNQLVVSLLGTDSSPRDFPVATLYNQDDTRVWTHFRATIDAADWAGSDAVLQWSGTGVDGYTHFFVDSIALLATVCE